MHDDLNNVLNNVDTRLNVYPSLAVSVHLRQVAIDPDAVVPAYWAREYLGIPPDEDVLKQGAEEMTSGTSDVSQ